MAQKGTKKKNPGSPMLAGGDAKKQGKKKK